MLTKAPIHRLFDVYWRFFIFINYWGNHYRNYCFNCRKPDAAYELAKALTEDYKECTGYSMGNNGLLITWTQGHLLSFQEPDEINPEWEDWSWDTITHPPNKLAY
ncbi:hypothetical protein [Lysinibacillus xylanilyticus]|uniref:Uncharacterized protein n=1 Tax=Lysinibacillus xylanilyticus TaxID=582475 RepID=A0A2M9Q5Q0_9BACI|nr:hypothetical protein [Lysinibacillus xylanilyticus]PJO43396.1 hypothetical protein CWD94_12660 [Lysinibacillus xylanilyticus]